MNNNRQQRSNSRSERLNEMLEAKALNQIRARKVVVLRYFPTGEIGQAPDGIRRLKNRTARQQIDPARRP